MSGAGTPGSLRSTMTLAVRHEREVAGLESVGSPPPPRASSGRP